VTDQQVVVVRALMGRDAETYRRLRAELDRKADRLGFLTVLCCCFIAALAADADLDDAAVEEFMATVRPMADRWADDHLPTRGPRCS
jgi:hypothetical protein